MRGHDVCILSPTCGEGVALEHNGDVYSCDHFVEPAYLLGNILETPIGDLVASEKQRAFGAAKGDTLPGFCRECRWLFTCNGECPKNRVLRTPDGEPGLNWLCEGLQTVLQAHRASHADHGRTAWRGRPADGVMKLLAEEERQLAASVHPSRAQRPLPLRERPEVQEMPRGLTGDWDRGATSISDS